MPSLLFKSLFIGTTLLASNASTTASASSILNWDISFLQVITDFSNGSTDEITLKYLIGTERIYQIDLFDKGCVEPITGTSITITPSTVTKDSSHDYLDVLFDMDKSTVASSNIWNKLASKIEFCTRLQLLSNSVVIKEDVRDISIAFDYQIDFTSNESSLREASLSSGSSTTTVENYVEACTCDDETSFTCNTDTLSPNSLLNICVRSVSTDMEIDFLNDLKLIQGADEMVIVETSNIQDPAISSMTMVPEKNGVHVASIIPSKFFSYTGTSDAVVTGVLFIKLTGSRRHLSVSFAGYPKVTSVSHHRLMRSDIEEVPKMDLSSDDGENDQQSPFVINVQLAKNLEVTNSSSSMMGGIWSIVAACGAIVALLVIY